MQTRGGKYFYLFRAKPVLDNDKIKSLFEDEVFLDSVGYDGTFIYGYYNGGYMLGEEVYVSEDYYSPKWWVPIKRGSLGIYIGKHDSNRERVYEGDIIEETLDGKKFLHEVKYDKVSTGFKPFCEKEITMFDFKVVGNVHDNYDLLEEE